MTKKGMLTGLLAGLVGYMDGATQEEAERLSDGRHTSGLIIFIPFDTGVPLESCFDNYLIEDD